MPIEEKFQAELKDLVTRMLDSGEDPDDVSDAVDACIENYGE